VLTALLLALALLIVCLLDMLLLAAFGSQPVPPSTFVNAMVPALWPGLFYVLAAAPFIGDLIAVAIWALIQLNVILLLHNLFAVSLSRSAATRHTGLCARPGGGAILFRQSWNAGYRRLIAISMAEPGPSTATTNSSAAFRGLLRSHRLGLRGLVVVLARRGDLGVGSASAFLLPVLGSVFSGPDLRLLISVVAALLLLLIPTAGIYSLIGQYAFWEGWLTGLPRPADLFRSAPSPPSAAPTRFLVYLDGIHQVERDHPPRVLRLLEEIERGLDPGTVLLKGMESYTVLPVKLADDRGSAWLWRRLFALQEEHPWPGSAFLAAFLVQANNVIKVGISSDRRYGPIAQLPAGAEIVHKPAAAWLRNRAAAAAGCCWATAVAARWRWAWPTISTSSSRSPIRILAFLRGVSAATSSLSMWSPLRWWWAAVIRWPPLAARLPRPPGLAAALSLEPGPAAGSGVATDAAGHGPQRRVRAVLRSLPLFPGPLACSTCSAARPEQKGAGEGRTATDPRAGLRRWPPPRGSRGRAAGCQGTGHGAPGPCVAVAPAASCAGHCPRLGAGARSRSRQRPLSRIGKREQPIAHGLLQQRRAVDAESRGLP